MRDDLGSSNWTEYTYLNGQPIEEVNSNGTWTDYIFANGERLAMASSVNATSPSTTTDYYTADQIGSGRIITNGSGAVISLYTSIPSARDHNRTKIIISSPAKNETRNPATTTSALVTMHL